MDRRNIFFQNKNLDLTDFCKMRCKATTISGEQVTNSGSNENKPATSHIGFNRMFVPNIFCSRLRAHKPFYHVNGFMDGIPFIKFKIMCDPSITKCIRQYL